MHRALLVKASLTTEPEPVRVATVHTSFAPLVYVSLPMLEKRDAACMTHIEWNVNDFIWKQRWSLKMVLRARDRPLSSIVRCALLAQEPLSKLKPSQHTSADRGEVPFSVADGTRLPLALSLVSPLGSLKARSTNSESECALPSVMVVRLVSSTRVRV